MADRKISELPVKAPADADESTSISGGGNFRWSFSQLVTYLQAFFAPSSHPADLTNPHEVTAVQAGADPAGTAQNAVDVHETTRDHPVFTAGLKGMVPPSGGGTTNYLRADGTFAEPPGGGGSGDVTGPASSTDSNFALFDGATGKVIKDDGVSASDFLTPAQGDADYARLAAANVYTAPNTFQSAFQVSNSSFRAGVAIDSLNTGDPEALVYLSPSGTISEETRNFYLKAGKLEGAIDIQSANGAGNDTAVPELRAFHTGGIVLGGATGGNQGLGTINTSGVYVDGVELTGGGGGSGTLNTVQDLNGGTASANRSIIEFRVTGDASVAIADDGPGDRSIVTIGNSAGGGGGYDTILDSGVPVTQETTIDFTLGIAAAPGVGKTNVFVNPAEISHDALAAYDPNEHFDHTTIAINAGAGLLNGGTIDTSRTLDVGEGDGITVNANDIQVDATVQRRISGGANGNLVSRDANGDVQDAGVSASTFLTAVVDDTAPTLGGPLQTDNNTIIVEDATSETGRIGATATADGIYLAHTSDGGFDPSDGAVAALAAEVELYGSVITVTGLKHSTAGGRQVYVGEDGGLFSVDPPEPGWEVSDTDAGSYDLGTGTGQAPTYTQVTGLSVNPVQDINIGDRVDYQIRLWVENKTTNRSGVIEVSIGLNGAQPTNIGTTFPIGPGFAGYVNVSVTVPSVSTPITTGDTMDVFARRTSGDNAQFGVDLVGTPNNHDMFVSVPGGGGSGEANDTRNDGGGVELAKTKEGVLLPFRTLDTVYHNQVGDLVELDDDAITYRATDDQAGAVVNLSYSGSPRIEISGTGGVTVNAPSGEGSLEVVITSSPTLSLVGFTEIGNQGGSFPQAAYVTGHSGTQYWFWGAALS